MKKKDIHNESTPSPSESRLLSGGMRIKICGMKYPDNILEVSQLLPDYMGFIFWEKSSRFFDGDIPKIPKSIKKVGVFVDADSATIKSKIEKHGLDVIQLHGKESVEFCKEIKNLKQEDENLKQNNENLKQNNENLKQVQIEVIKVFSVDDDFDFNKLKEFEAVCDFFLFDTKGKLPGGNGYTFDWGILKKYNSDKPFFLSGGIGIEEFESIKKLNLPIYAIDVNSKFETEPGLKSVELLKLLITNLNS